MYIYIYIYTHTHKHDPASSEAPWGSSRQAILYCTILYYTVLYCTILYCTILHYNILCYAMIDVRTHLGLKQAGLGSPGRPARRWGAEELYT